MNCNSVKSLKLLHVTFYIIIQYRCHLDTYSLQLNGAGMNSNNTGTQCPSLPLDRHYCPATGMVSSYLVANIRVTVTVSTRIQRMMQQYTHHQYFKSQINNHQFYNWTCTIICVKLTVKYDSLILWLKNRNPNSWYGSSMYSSCMLRNRRQKHS